MGAAAGRVVVHHQPAGVSRETAALISMWLDMLVLRTMNQGKPGARPVWFILDELQSLHALPQLHTAITESRKARNPVVLGFQGRSQLEELYGRKAEAMLSQPATKVFLRTDEANSSKWISQTIGEVEIERLRESRMEGHFPGTGGIPVTTSLSGRPSRW